MTCENCTSARYLPGNLNCSYQIKCEKTGKLHGVYDTCDVTATAASATECTSIYSPSSLCSPLYTKCLVCGELAEISNVRLPVRICDKCKAAIRYIRDNFTEKEK